MDNNVNLGAEIKAIAVPDWFRKGAVYQINPRTFSKEGTIRAILSELPFLKELGFDIIYLCPIFEADESMDMSHWSERQKKSQTGNPKNPYRIKNFFEVDDEYGTMEDLKCLVESAHALEMRVIFDLVYLHMGHNAPILKKHPEFAKRDAEGNPICNAWNFVTLDFDSIGLREYLWTNMVYFTSELDVDGFRCDTADDVPNDFWAEGRKRIQAVKSDAVLINEGNKYGRLAHTFDCIYGFTWCYGIHYLFEGKITAQEFQEWYHKREKDIPAGGLLLRILDTHDTVTDWEMRSECLLGHDGMELAQVMNYAIDGVPMVYCGNELADEARLSMFANRFYMGEFEVTDRNQKNTAESLRRQELYKKLNQLCKTCDAITRGTTTWVENSCPEKVISFARDFEGKRVLFVGNASNTDVEVSIPENLTGCKVLLQNGCEITDSGVQMTGHGYVLVEI